MNDSARPLSLARISTLTLALAAIFPIGQAAVFPLGLAAQAKPAATAPDLHLPAGADKAAEAIDHDTIAAGIRTLADDKMEGRAPASKGDELARAYLQESLKSLGYQPGAPEGGWQQLVEFVSVLSKMPKSWAFQAGEKTLSLAWSDDYIAASGVQQETTTIEDAEVVFVGYGIQAPEYGWDDYKGANLKGKILLMLNNDPDWDPTLFAGARRLLYGRWTYKYESGARQGAAGVLIIHTAPSAGYPWQVVQSSWGGKQFHLPAGAEPTIQLAGWASEAAASRLVEASGQSLAQLRNFAKHKDFRPIPLGVKTSLTFSNQIERVKSANVLGRLEGSDPKLKEEVVLYSAHHDHFGIGEPDKTGDKIYNGAVDNASGCAMVLAVAKAFTALPQRPKRSIVVAFVAGEEQGLLGSAYLAAHPPVPPGKIAANVNVDSGNILGPTKDVTYIGYGKSSLDGVIEALAARQGRTVKGDQFPDKGSFYRSDQFNFAKIGVPALYLTSGTDVIGKPPGWGAAQLEAWTLSHYHQPNDEYDPNWNLGAMIEDARLGFLAGLSVAETPALPTWNAGDEFEAARKGALGGDAPVKSTGRKPAPEVRPTGITTRSTIARSRSRSAPAFALVALLPFAAPPTSLQAQDKPAAPALDLHLPVGADKAAEAIDRATIDAGMRILADDKMEGRAPASKGDEMARAYLQSELQRIGFQPGAPEGGYQQPVPFVSILSQLPKTWTFQAGKTQVSLALRDDYIGGSLAQQPRSTIRDAELVFVGYGIQAPEYGWDDFKGADLRGKVLVMLNNDPDWDPKLFAGFRRLYYGRWVYKQESAARQGAAALILLHTTPSAGYPWQVVQSSWSGKQFHLPAQPAPAAKGEPALQLAAWTTEEAMRKLVTAGASGHDLAELVAAARSRNFRPIPLGLKTSLTFRNQVERVQSANVLGRLEGSDPKLKEEIVLYTAHHDHLGVGAPDKTGDRIYNGARDNASGCAMALAVVKAYTALPTRPKRTIVIAFVAGEEQGLLGSEFLAAHPPVPPGKLAANVNIDGGTFLGRTTDVTSVGFGKSSLDPVVAALAARQGRKVHGDPVPDLGLFYRSDQFSFAKIGVPALFLTSGTGVIGAPPGWGGAKLQAWVDQHYHQPSDNYEPNLNLAGLIEDAQLGFLTGLSVAETLALPTWNPGDEFEAARKRALGVE